MSEYIEEEYIGWIDYSYDDSPIPIIDQNQEIVRCRDCKHYDRMNDDEGMCMVPDDDGDYARWMVDDVGYCYLGERKEGGDD